MWGGSWAKKSKKPGRTGLRPRRPEPDPGRRLGSKWWSVKTFLGRRECRKFQKLLDTPAIGRVYYLECESGDYCSRLLAITLC